MEKKIDKEIGLRVRRRREALGYSREKLAEVSGLAVSFLGSVELGKSDFSVSTLKKLCAALGVSSDYILFGNEQDGAYSQVSAMLSGLDAEYLPMVEELLGAYVKSILAAEQKKQPD